MGAYDENSGHEVTHTLEARSQGNSLTENRIKNLMDEFAALGLDPESILQIRKAVEGADNIIKQQNSDAYSVVEISSDTLVGEPIQGIRKTLVSPPTFDGDSGRWKNDNFLVGPDHPHNHQNIESRIDSFPYMQTTTKQFCNISNSNDIADVNFSGRTGVGSSGISEFSSISQSFSPTRHQRGGECDSNFHLTESGLVPTVDKNPPGALWKQELVLKVREHEEEITQLRRHLTDYSLKEYQICNEKHALEKRIADMRLAFDRLQKNEADAASKMLSCRHDIIEENIRLAYALQAAQQEKDIFFSSLLPLLRNYGVQPPVPDAQSIVTNLKALFRRLNEMLCMSETTVKEPRYHFSPWCSDAVNNHSTSTLSHYHSVGANVSSLRQTPVSSNSQITRADDQGVVTNFYNPFSCGVPVSNPEYNHFGRFSHLEVNSSAGDALSKSGIIQGDIPYCSDDQVDDVSSCNFINGIEPDGANAHVPMARRGRSVHWAPGVSSHAAADTPLTFPRFLPPVLEEPCSSFSEDDDPLPAIDGLQIDGDAFPGHILKASGYSVNGTTSCYFEWVRHLQDGSVNYITGAKQPIYLVTADDVDTYLAIEVQPLDNRRRKGELVKVFANDRRKITCDHGMQEQIDKFLFAGHASFEVLLWEKYEDIWKPAILAIKRAGYSIKCHDSRDIVIVEKFSATNVVTIPFGQSMEFSIRDSHGIEYLLRSRENGPLRDTIVLIVRAFISKGAFPDYIASRENVISMTSYAFNHDQFLLYM